MNIMSSAITGIYILASVIILPLQEVNAGILSKTAVKVAARKAAVRKATAKAAANQTSKKPQLVDRIIRDANRVTPSGAKITKSQRNTLYGNLPVVKRRNVKATKAMRTHFNSNAKNNTGSRKKLIQRWEMNRERKWPKDSKGHNATAHHIIPLESGGANKWWNLSPTFGSSPNHSLKGVAGPHAKKRVLRKTIQKPRSKMRKSNSKGAYNKYRETDLGLRE
jgi:5-methylcytosine-specific restriction endonuclease McrA